MVPAAAKVLVAACQFPFPTSDGPLRNTTIDDVGNAGDGTRGERAVSVSQFIPHELAADLQALTQRASQLQIAWVCQFDDSVARELDLP